MATRLHSALLFSTGLANLRLRAGPVHGGRGGGVSEAQAVGRGESWGTAWGVSAGLGVPAGEVRGSGGRAGRIVGGCRRSYFGDVANLTLRTTPGVARRVDAGDHGTKVKSAMASC